MVILIAGDTHTGKTLLAQKLLEKYHYPYLSIDHLKMGLIRSGQCKPPADSNKCHTSLSQMPQLTVPNATLEQRKCHSLAVAKCGISAAKVWHCDW